MGILDSDSECDSSISSTGEWDVPEEANQAKKGSKKNVISNVNVLEGDIEERLKSIMTLKDAMGVEEDPDYVEKENRKQALKDQLAEQKRKEEEAKKNMTLEERLVHDKNSVGDMMERIKAKREASKKDLLASSSHHSRKTPARSKSSDGMVRRLPRRTGSNVSLGAMSACSAHSCDTAASGMSDDQMSEFEKLKAKKARRKLKKTRSGLSAKAIAVQEAS